MPDQESAYQTGDLASIEQSDEEFPIPIGFVLVLSNPSESSSLPDWVSTPIFPSRSGFHLHSIHQLTIFLENLSSVHFYTPSYSHCLFLPHDLCFPLSPLNKPLSNDDVIAALCQIRCWRKPTMRAPALPHLPNGCHHSVSSSPITLVPFACLSYPLPFQLVCVHRMRQCQKTNLHRPTTNATPQTLPQSLKEGEAYSLYPTPSIHTCGSTSFVPITESTTAVLQLFLQH